MSTFDNWTILTAVIYFKWIANQMFYIYFEAGNRFQFRNLVLMLQKCTNLMYTLMKSASQEQNCQMVLIECPVIWENGPSSIDSKGGIWNRMQFEKTEKQNVWKDLLKQCKNKINWRLTLCFKRWYIQLVSEERMHEQHWDRTNIWNERMWTF